MRVPRPSPGKIRGAAAPGHPFCGGGARRCLVRGTRLRALVAVDRRVLATACNLDGSPTSTLLWGLVGPLLAAMLASRRRYGPGAPAVSSRSWRHCASGGTSLRSCGRTGHGASRQVRGCALDRDDVSCYGLNADPLISKEASAAGLAGRPWWLRWSSSLLRRVGGGTSAYSLSAGGGGSPVRGASLVVLSVNLVRHRHFMDG